MVAILCGGKLVKELKALRATHLMLVIVCVKYEENPSSNVDATEATRDYGKRDRQWTDSLLPAISRDTTNMASSLNVPWGN